MEETTNLINNEHKKEQTVMLGAHRGRVMLISSFLGDAPSIAAASFSEVGMFCSPAT